MTDFFDTMLPGVLQEHNMTLHVTPKFSDLRDNEYMRYPLELRYGANDRLEYSADSLRSRRILSTEVATTAGDRVKSSGAHVTTWAVRSTFSTTTTLDWKCAYRWGDHRSS